MTRTMEQFPYFARLEYASMGRLSGVVAVLLLLGVSFGSGYRDVIVQALHL
jgi:hypothetical protein